MDVNKLKYVVGEAKNGKPAVIRLFGAINEYTTNEFNNEFLWLQDVVVPSKIRVIINSEGGSVLYGMSSFSMIQNCPIEVETVIEGIAASMASVIWAAGDRLYMHDYSILMIHNPFSTAKDSKDADTKNMIKAFKTQLETIYNKRFGLSKEKVREIMDGEGDADGTYFNAKEAVKAGIISNDDIIKTSKKLCDKIKNEIKGITNAATIREVMALATQKEGGNKLIKISSAINKQENNKNQTDNLMEKQENVHFEAIVAQLGLSENAPLKDATARVNELMGAESELKTIKNALKNSESKLNELDIKFKGKLAEVENLHSELEVAKASLKKYQDAEKAAREAEIVSLVENAIEAGKIADTAKSEWIKMANSNLDMVKTTLDSIPIREKITKEIATDPKNIKNIEDSVESVEAKIEKKVKGVLGNEFKLKKF